MEDFQRSEIDTKELIEQRKQDVFNFFKKNAMWIFYLVLAAIVGLAVYIRTRNLHGLKDITTGTWTLGPDLDPFLFLRWAKYIIEHGSLFVIDNMRYVPLGYNTLGETKLLPYMIVWLYKFLSVFSNEMSVTYAAIIFPVVMFALTVVAFFFLVRKIFYNSFGDKKIPNLIALVACFFLTVLPPLLARTIAGIPEKESAAFFFMFLAFYFFICAWDSKTGKSRILFSILSGIATGCMALIWGGYAYIFLTIGLTVFIGFLIGQVDLKKFYAFCIWLAVSLSVMIFFSSRFTLKTVIESRNIGACFVVLAIVLVYFAISKTKIKNYFQSEMFSKLPLQLISAVIGLVLLIIVSLVFFGPDFIVGKFSTSFTDLVKPATSRLIQTVAENRQPFFKEWSGSFGPYFGQIPIFFSLFFVGSVLLFYNMIRKLRTKEKFFLSFSYVVFISTIVFSRYASNSILNGENWQSLTVYFGGVILFFGILGWQYINLYKENRLEKLKTISFGLILLLSFFVLGIVSARGAVRLIMMLVPSTSAIAAYFIVFVLIKGLKSFSRKEGDDFKKIFVLIVAGIVLIGGAYSGLFFYKSSLGQAETFYPSQYQWQWQKAMSWIRENVSEDAVFGHWWDYGYWLQSIGERATIVDGGNSIPYWNHLMGRYVLTTPDDATALEFLYTHDATHYLIDSTEIGKYGAYSKIGSNASYDRISYIPTFTMNQQATQETQDGIMFVYNLGIGLDEDIFYEENGTIENGTEIPGTTYSFAKENSGIAGVIVNLNTAGEMLQPSVVVVSQGIQTTLPMRYVYSDDELYDFESGVESGIFLMDFVNPSGGELKGVERGAGFYFSSRTVNSFMVRKYLFGEEGDFRLVHSEPNFVIGNLREQGAEVDDFILFQGNFLGPIKIWEINYPEDIEKNPEFLNKEYPKELKFA